MKKLVLIVAAFLGLSAGSASATCTGPAVMHDFPSTAFNMSLATAPDGNCASNNAITTWGGISLGAPSNYGTSPGAVAVIGVNAFVTNFPATQPVSGTFWQATQPVSGTFWQATQPVSAASLPLPSGAGTAANQATIITALGTLNTTAGNPLAAGTNLIGKVGIDQTTDGTTNGVRLTSAYPSGATPITASTTGTSAATTATLAGAASKTTYVCGYSIRANATANTNVTNTLTGVISGTMSSIMWVPANTAGLGVDEQIFNPCIPASAQNTAISAVSGAPGTGGLVSSKLWGYQQ